MQYLFEKTSYLRGLAEGLGINSNTKEKKLITAVIDVLDDIVTAVDKINIKQEDMDYLDSKDFTFEYICPNCTAPINLEHINFDESENIIVKLVTKR